MELVDFNANFAGFPNEEDILVDSGVLFALLNSYDSWHQTISNLFDVHVYNNPNTLFLYINPCIQTEVTHLSTVEKLVDKHVNFNAAELELLNQKISNNIKILIENEVLLILNVNKDALIRQLATYNIFGSVDALNLSMANDYGINFLTVDNRLVQKAHDNSHLFPDIPKIYHTHNKHQTPTKTTY